MIFDTTVDIYKRTESSGIGSGGDYSWTTKREADVDAKKIKRGDLARAKERVGSQRDIAYDHVFALPRYDEGNERTVAETDKIGHGGDKYEITGIDGSSVYLFVSVKEPV